MTLAPEPVVLDVSPSGVAVVLLNRPEKKNAFDELVIAGLADAFETLKGADHVRIVFLKGAGDTFSAGADLEWMKRQGEHLRADNEADAFALAKMLKALHDLPQFTVALVDGAAMGGGAGLVAAADYAVATARTKFRFSEVRLGLTPATISPYVIEAIGPRHARALFASALPFTAADAHRFGLIHEIVEDEPGLDGAMKRLAGLAMENAPGAVADAKALVRHVVDSITRPRLTGGHVIDNELMHDTARRIADRRASEEGREGLAAFLEKRPPKWSQ
ncbi:MAG: enoyl-CoA hydratase/isomerase family protein [Hydrogenophilaceae bacterium]|jgi:methylglutaconyl-CoA hydratase|nr:enoyl-CoA hydratase/isomerase family protein [Hydrogenophilaceae bacterium]